VPDPECRRATRGRAAALAVTVLAFVVGALGVAVAGPVTGTSQTIASGVTAVATCGSLGSMVIAYTISGTTVTTLTFTGIPSTCNGGQLRATVSSGSTALGAGGPVAVASGGATVTLSPAPATGSVTHVRLVIVGP
jgi:hypothetical protein